MEEMVTTHLIALVILPGRMMQEEMTTKDIYLLHAIKNDIPTNWAEVLKDHMAKAARRNSHYLPYAILISSILMLQRVDTRGERKYSCNCTNVLNRNTLVSNVLKEKKIWCMVRGVLQLQMNTKQISFQRTTLCTLLLTS